MMTQEDWDFCADKAHQLFAFGQATALKHGFILVDTKYEFGKDCETNEILLIDEIHTPDSSRYWIAEGYAEIMSESGSKVPSNIDKEFVRLWYKERCGKYSKAKESVRRVMESTCSFDFYDSSLCFVGITSYLLNSKTSKTSHF